MAQLGLSDLPDALLTAVLGALEPADLRRAAQVSRRWHECAHVPQLCRTVKCDSGARQIRSLRQLRSLVAWLQRHGQHVRRLSLRLWVPMQQAHQLLASCFAACTQLEDLGVETCLDDETLVIGTWVQALTRLRRLAFSSGTGGVLVATSLHPLAALRALRLDGSMLGVQLATGVQLPPGLEELALKDWASTRLPSQLSGLTALHTLVLSTNSGGGSDGRLERLPRLRRLELSDCERLPASLSRLTGLEELMLYSVGDAAGLDAALRSLTSLTSLAMFNMQPPPSVAGLSRLQRACFTYSYGNPPGGYTALPTGPWAASLRQLCASYDTLLLSGDLLPAAVGLEQVGVSGRDFAGAVRPYFPPAALEAASERFWRWCAEHPPLRELHFELVSYSPAEPALVAAVEELAAARPSISVHRHMGDNPVSGAFFLSV